MESIDQTPISTQQTTATTGVVSTPIYKEPHILEREPHIHLSTPFDKLEVLSESLVDFDNMKRNGIDLTEELRMQGWETYFQRLYGPVYTYLIKEFWHFADSDDHYIVSHVLGVKIVITKKSIASLMNMETIGGRRIYNINPRAKYLSQEIALTIFQQNAEGKHSKNKELHQNLRVWMKIILGTTHHLPTSNFSDYINTDQKCILYYIHKGLKLNLPALLFKYIRDSVKDTRNNMKPRTHIPLRRLISNVLIESGLVDHLIHNNLMEDVTIDIGRPLNAQNLKSMGVIEQVRTKPTLDTSWEALKDQRKIPNGLYLFSKIDPPEVVAHYLQDLASQGVDICLYKTDKAKMVRLQTHKRQLEFIQMKEKETINDFAATITHLVNRVKACGETFTEQHVVTEILHSLMPRFDNIVVTIEDLKDMATMSKYELQSSLQAHEQRMEERNNDKAKVEIALQARFNEKDKR
ncbi:uncharacterized protein LOC127122190 [Lathyrus oleraceus]|uniref:uncharacterized protein LOC127122190 n=1 Tax=Pisum sativum TaxID=3888 RepID=UPI0021D077DF|nr:uncharacterized protein LOC127122190 [Pisum sativum]